MPWRDAPHLAALQLPYAPEVQTAQHPNVQPISAVAAVASAVEMEALVAVTTALLNIWDVLKMYEKDENGQYPFTKISNIHVIKKVKR